MKHHLVYGVYFFGSEDESGMLVFFEQADAERRASEWTAVDAAKTWGQFRKLVPKKKYDAILSYFDTVNEPRPKSHDSFDGYAPWLANEEWTPLESMVDILPRAVVALGQRADTPGMGDWVSFEPKQESQVVDALQKAGYAVVRNDALVRRASGHWVDDNFESEQSIENDSATNASPLPS